MDDIKLYTPEESMEREKLEIERITGRIAELEAQREKLETVYECLIKLTETFNSEHEMRVKKIKGIDTLYTSKCSRAYSEGMSGYLNGSDFSKTSDGLASSKAKLKKQILEIDEEIEELKAELEKHRASLDMHEKLKKSRESALKIF